MNVRGKKGVTLVALIITIIVNWVFYDKIFSYLVTCNLPVSGGLDKFVEP